MGLLDAISGGLTAGTQAAAGQQEGNIAGSSIIRQILMQQAQQAHLGAQTSHLARQDAKPQDGDPGYQQHKSTLEAAIAGAKTDAETPGLVKRAEAMSPITTQTAANTAAAVAPVKVKEAADTVTATAGPKALAKKLEVDTTAGSEARAAGMKAQAEVPAKLAVADPRISNGVAKMFTSQNKGLVDTEQPYRQAKDALAQATTNPQAYKTAIINYAGAADPKARLTQGMIQMISQLDPSVHGRLDLFIKKNLEGTITPQSVAGMAKVLDAMHQTHRDMYQQRYDAVVSRNPGTERYLSAPHEIFDAAPPSGGQSGAAPAAPGTFTYGGKTYKAP